MHFIFLLLYILKNNFFIEHIINNLYTGFQDISFPPWSVVCQCTFACYGYLTSNLKEKKKYCKILLSNIYLNFCFILCYSLKNMPCNCFFISHLPQRIQYCSNSKNSKYAQHVTQQFFLTFKLNIKVQILLLLQQRKITFIFILQHFNKTNQLLL